MNMEYRNRSSSSRSSPLTSDPFWLILSAIMILVLFLIGLPAIVGGFFGQRYAYRHLSRFGWRWSAAVWLLSSLLAMLLLYALFQHGLQQMMQRELADYVQSGKHYQFDLTRWNFGRLWSETWPVWLRTLVVVPLWGLWFEISTNARGGTARMLVQNERGRQYRIARAQQRARKRTLRPERLPDSVAGMMVIGVPIDDEEQE